MNLRPGKSRYATTNMTGTRNHGSNDKFRRNWQMGLAGVYPHDDFKVFPRLSRKEMLKKKKHSKNACKRPAKSNINIHNDRNPPEFAYPIQRSNQEAGNYLLNLLI